MGNKVLITAEIVLDFFEDRGEATREAQAIIRGSLRGSYEIVITEGMVDLINYGLLGKGKTFLEAQESLNDLFKLISVINISESEASNDKLAQELMIRNGVSAIVTRSNVAHNYPRLAVFSPEEFLFLFKDLVN